jgi:hypothetical protein
MSSGRYAALAPSWRYMVDPVGGGSPNPYPNLKPSLTLL